MIITKIRHWQAELREMIEAFKEEKKGGPIVAMLKKREEEIAGLIEALQDKSFIPRGDMSFEPGPPNVSVISKSCRERSRPFLTQEGEKKDFERL